MRRFVCSFTVNFSSHLFRLPERHLNDTTENQEVNKQYRNSCIILAMSKRHGGKRAGAGRKSLEDLYDERIVEMTIRIPESYYRHASSQGVPASEYLRRLIAADMEANQPGPKPE
jgi:hypothetical protein